MNERIKIINQNGEEVEADVLLYFNLESTGKDYVLYTFGEKDDQNMETVHASIVEKDGEGFRLDTMPDEDWETVKEVMRDVIIGEEG